LFLHGKWNELMRWPRLDPLVIQKMYRCCAS